MVGALLSLVWWYDLGVAWDVVRTHSIGWLDLVIRPIGISIVTLLAIRLCRSHQQTGLESARYIQRVHMDIGVCVDR